MSKLFVIEGNICIPTRWCIYADSPDDAEKRLLEEGTLCDEGHNIADEYIDAASLIVKLREEAKDE